MGSRPAKRATRAVSSVGQSTCFTRRGSEVQVLYRPPSRLEEVLRPPDCCKTLGWLSIIRPPDCIGMGGSANEKWLCPQGYKHPSAHQLNPSSKVLSSLSVPTVKVPGQLSIMKAISGVFYGTPISRNGLMMSVRLRNGILGNS